jgi:hypothetical protein
VLLLEAGDCFPEPTVPNIKMLHIFWSRVHDKELSTFAASLDRGIQNLLVSPFFGPAMVNVSLLALCLPCANYARGQKLLGLVYRELH